jgi:hypothetical protein
MRQYGLAGITLALLLGMGIALWGQQPGGEPKEPAEQIKLLEERVSAVEKLLSGLISSPGTPANAGLATRLDRIENRLSRLESDATRYRPGTPSSAGQVESRLSALEREIVRLRR